MTLFGRTHPTEVEAERAHRRRWILVPGVVVLVCAVFGLVSALGPFRTHEDTISQTYAGGVKKVVIDSPGDLDVAPADGSRLSAEWQTHWNYTRPNVRQVRDGGTLRLSLDCSHSVGVECYADLRLAVPKGVALDVMSDNGTSDIRGVTGPVSVRNTNGDISVEHVKGGVDASTRSGSVTLRGIGGGVTAESRSGDITARGLRGRTARLETVSGDVAAEFRTTPTDVDAQARSGDVEVRVPRGTGPYLVRPQVRSGDLATQVKTDPSARNTIAVRTASGDVSVGYTDDAPGHD